MQKEKRLNSKNEITQEPLIPVTVEKEEPDYTWAKARRRGFSHNTGAAMAAQASQGTGLMEQITTGQDYEYHELDATRMQGIISQMYEERTRAVANNSEREMTMWVGAEGRESFDQALRQETGRYLSPQFDLTGTFLGT